MACSAAGPTLVHQTRPAAPSKDPKTPYVSGGMRHFSAWAYDAASAEDAHALASNNALLEAAKQLAVTVGGTHTIKEREKDGEYSYDIVAEGESKACRVMFQGREVKDRYEECFELRGEQKCNGYVELAIPIAELQAAERVCRGRILFAYQCDVSDAACRPAGEEMLRAAAQQAGLTLLDEMVTGDVSAEDAGTKHDAGYVFKITVSAAIVGNEGDAWFARGSGLARLVETRYGKTVATVDTGELKEGAYSESDALRMVVKAIIKRLAVRIQGHDFAGAMSGEEL